MVVRIRRLIVATVLVALLLVPLYAAREVALDTLGRTLVKSDAPSRVDILVVMRGDEIRFERALAVADLYSTGYARQIYVSSALNDAAGLALASRGASLPTAQENIARVLLQRGVPCGAIVLDGSPPGGGTLGEARRIVAFMSSRGLSSALIVTSWFHSRRTSWIVESVLGASGKHGLVVVASGEVGPHNWWVFRYDAIAVLEEFIKLALHVSIGWLKFRDDPRASESTSKDACSVPAP